MSYRLENGRKLVRSLATAVNRQLTAAIRQVLTAGPGNPEAVHQVRMHLKKTRAALRLVRSALGERSAALSGALRDIARRLSAGRDEEILLDTFERLTAALPQAGQAGQAGLAGVREWLAQRRAAAMQIDPAERTQWLLALVRLQAALHHWPAACGAAVADGWLASFKRARQCWRALAQHRDPERVHEWRKRVKTHWYHSRLLRAHAPPGSRRRRRQLRKLSVLLGDFHDLAVLCDQMALRPEAFGTPDQVAEFARLAAAEQSRLVDLALALGQELFDRKAPRLPGSH